MKSWRSSVVEQLICNQQVGGSNPFASSTDKMHDAGYRMFHVRCTVNHGSCIMNHASWFGEVAEWTKAADCKSAGASLRRFESCPPHHSFRFKDKEFATEFTEKIEKVYLNKIFKTPVFSVAISEAGVAQLARASAFQAEGRGFESRLPLKNRGAHVAQSAEHILGKDEVSGSSPLVGSTTFNEK
jgi:hypothetical protein